MTEFVQHIAEAMANSVGAPLSVFLLSMIPIAEARFAIPFGMSMGLTPWESFGWAFFGSTAIIPILLLVLIPTINALSKTKAFSKLGKFLYDKFYKKSRSLADEPNADDAKSSEAPNAPDAKKKKKKILTKSDLKRMGGTALFVAIPLPLTGVWTGSAVASIVKVGFVKALIGVTLGNAAACGIITLISWLFEPYVEWITLAFFIIAVVVVIALIVKLIIYKPKDASVDAQTTTETNEKEIQTDKTFRSNINNINKNVADDDTSHNEE